MKESELLRSPNTLGLPSDFAWPKKVQDEIDVWDTAYMEWDDVNATLSEKHAALKDAKAKDARALVDAVAAGKPDPGTKATDKAERDVVYWEEVVRQARSRADKQASSLWKVIEAHYEQIVAQANAQALQGADEFALDIKSIAEQGRKAVEKRHKALAGLRFVSRFTGKGVAFDPFFPVEGTFSVPHTSDTRVRSTVKLLADTVNRRGQEVA